MLPKLIVFDCDACLWTPECFQISPPFVRVDDHTVMSGRNTPVKLFPGALHAIKQILEHTDFRENDTQIALASTTRYPEHSKVLRENFHVLPGKPLGSIVSSAQIYYADTKISHFQNIKKETGIEFKDMLFFDDCIWGDNVGDVERGLGVVGIRTPNGMTVEKWEEGLAKFRAVRGS